MSDENIFEGKVDWEQRLQDGLASTKRQVDELARQRDVLTDVVEGMAHFAPGPAGRIARDALVELGFWVDTVDADERPYPDADEHAAALLAKAREERDAYVRIVNRLDAAVTHHEQADRFREDHDEALYAARARIMRSLLPPPGANIVDTPTKE